MPVTLRTTRRDVLALLLLPATLSVVILVVTGPPSVGETLAGMVVPGTEDAGPDRTVTVNGTEYRFAPSTIPVERGETVRVTFVNTGTRPHTLLIKPLDIISEVVWPGEQDSFTFTAPEDGTYPLTFKCTFRGHAEAGMNGTVVVK